MATISEALADAIRHHRSGRLQTAEEIYRQILTIEPKQAEAHHLLGVIAHQVGKPEAAAAYIKRAIALKGEVAEFHINLGTVYHDLGQYAEALACGQRAVALDPGSAGASNNLGKAYEGCGQLDEAAACFRRAIELKPDFATPHNNLGKVLLRLMKAEAAAGCFRRALELSPEDSEICNSLGVALAASGKLDDAISSFGRALELNPALAQAHNNLGNACKDAGRLDEAIASFRKAVAAEPHNDGIHSNLINTLNYHPAYDAVSIGAEHQRWTQKFAAPLRPWLRPHVNNRDPDRRLRIGYVSPDFREHIVGRTVLPLLQQHDHTRFEIFCYASVARPDAITRRFQETVDAWRDITQTPAQAAADLIRADQIDILIDLNLHAGGNRLTVFARKPAPVQATWAGYPGATGLDTIDYRLTDPWLDPPQSSETPSSEMPIRLPQSFWCYAAPTAAPPVNPLPALGSGHVTFGSLNNFCKVNAGVITLWSQALGAVKGSRLLLLSKEGVHRERALEEFERSGIAAERIEWLSPAAQAQYLAAYHRIDLGLDTLPYNGHTTSLDSFWMGVPVITLVGKSITGRVGLSQAMNLGLSELIASSPEQFVERAVELAQNWPRLSRLRASLRERMKASLLMNPIQFTRDIEAAYRTMWRLWCGK